MNWHDFLAYLMTAKGIDASLAILASLLCEYWPWFQNLAKLHKQLFYGAICLALPLAAGILGILSAGFPASWENTLFPALATGAVSAFSVTMVRAGALAIAQGKRDGNQPGL